MYYLTPVLCPLGQRNVSPMREAAIRPDKCSHRAQRPQGTFLFLLVVGFARTQVALVT